MTNMTKEEKKEYREYFDLLDLITIKCSKPFYDQHKDEELDCKETFIFNKFADIAMDINNLLEPHPNRKPWLKDCMDSLNNAFRCFRIHYKEVKNDIKEDDNDKQ